MKRKVNKTALVLGVLGAVLFGVISVVVIRSTRTVTAVVPNQTIPAGVTVTSDMLSVIQVPVDTPGEYCIDPNAVIGQKLKINAQPNQFLYLSDIMISWGDVVFGVDVPDDYIITAISIPESRAVGGLITAGDSVDILGVGGQTGGYYGNEKEQMAQNLGAIAEHSYGADGINVYWILANVKILETNSTLAANDDGILSSIVGEGSGNSGTYYIVALSYADYQKLILAQSYLTLWMNISPVWNNEHAPLLDVMTYSELQGLLDAQAQSIVEEIQREDGQIVTRIRPEKQAEIDEAKARWMEEHGYEMEEEGQPEVETNPVIDDDESDNGGEQ